MCPLGPTPTGGQGEGGLDILQLDFEILSLDLGPIFVVGGERVGSGRRFRARCFVVIACVLDVRICFSSTGHPSTGIERG